MKIITVGGTGYWGSKLTRVFIALGHDICADVSLPGDGVADLSEAVKTHGQCPVVIATPPKTHMPIAMAALALGCDVFIEKPIATNQLHAFTIASEAVGRGLVVSVDSTFVHSECFAHLKNIPHKLIEYQSMRMSNGPAHVTTPAGWDLCIHDTSILAALGVKIRGSKGLELGNVCQCYFHTDGGHAWLSASRVFHSRMRDVMLRFANDKTYCWTPRGLWEVSGVDRFLVCQESEETLFRVVRDFTDRVQYRKVEGLTDATHGAVACSILETAIGGHYDS